MNAIELKELWKQEEEKGFTGWDFSYINNRIEEEKLPWDYKQIVSAYLKSNDKLLDMGTGGGEFLLTLNHPYQHTSVTEAYLPNVALCKDKLGRFGIDVRQVIDDGQLPFENETMDIIINRHESYDITEVYRLLKSNGIFITQQVGPVNNFELSKFLLQDGSKRQRFDNALETEVEKAKDSGFNIIKTEEFFPYLKFFDVGALVYFAKIIEWEFPNFSVDKAFDQLMKIHELINKDGFIASKEHRYIMVVQKV